MNNSGWVSSDSSSQTPLAVSNSCTDGDLLTPSQESSLAQALEEFANAEMLDAAPGASLGDANAGDAGLRIRGKPQPQASGGKIAKKRMTGAVGRPKGSGKSQTAAGLAPGPGSGTYNRKQPKVAEFGRKRGPKPKMRGVFGAPGVGLQRPQSDGSSCGGSGSTGGGCGNGSTSGSSGITAEGEPCLENRLVLCSAQDEYVLTQDVCVMCGAFGLDQEGRLMACAQCGQCYHPYCANVKVL